MEAEKLRYLEDKAHELRHLTLDMCIRAKTGHVTSSFSAVEILTALYNGKILRKDPKNPRWEDRDRFILSKGQASPILYTTLTDNGYFPKSWLRTFNTANGHFGVHLQCDVPGVEYTTGSLGHGLGIGNGVALAAKKNSRDYKTFVLLGDAELQEGSCWEAAMLSSTLKLDNLIAIVDRNGYGVLCRTEESAALNPLDKKFAAYGWEPRVINGHSFEEIFKSLEDARTRNKGVPLVVIANTIKGKGLPSWQNVALRHGTAPTNGEVDQIIDELSAGCRYSNGKKCPLYGFDDLDKWKCPRWDCQK